MFIKKKLRQLGNKFGLELIEAQDPADLFIKTMKYYYLDIPNVDQGHKFFDLGVEKFTPDNLWAR